MRRPSSLALVALVALIAPGCAPSFDVAVTWTIAGLEPTAACSALPDDTAVVFTVTSRENADKRFGGNITETTSQADCVDGSAAIQTGAFAGIVAKLSAGDEIIGSAPSVSVAPGASGRGFAEQEAPAAIDLEVLQGTLSATLTVGGRSCGEVGAGAFTVSLFEAAEPNALVPVDGAVDVSVPCTEGAATFVFSPIHLGSSYRVQATTTVLGVTYATASVGEGITPTAPATFMAVDLQAR
jgi:hypothetical protein